MPNKRVDKSCVEIRVCVENDLEKDIIKFQASQIAKTGNRSYWKPEAASDHYAACAKYIRENDIMLT